MIALTLFAGAAAAQRGSGESGTPVGVWDITISFRDCATGEITRVRPGLMSFMPGGVMQEFGTGTAPNDRSDAQGVWSHQTARGFYSVSKAFRFAADGSLAGSVKLYRQFELTSDGSAIAVDVFSEIYNPAGVLVGTGCATEAGTRLQ
jgi:hypothetical protein